LQLRGIALADVEIMNAMDEQGIVLPKMLNQDGSLKSLAKALDMRQMKALLAHARDMAAILADRIFSGETHIAPVQSEAISACNYCEFHAICGIEADSPDAPFRRVPSMDMEELRLRLAGEPWLKARENPPS
ncbi:MAG: PD-(D/E)XK nuclease family protein, partial [Clostridia bacterium]|nr:PD-(D/E)XK nuclease family protein [Clostridia bacterium]